MSRHATHIDVYFDPTDRDLPFSLEPLKVDGATRVSYEVDQAPEYRDSYPESDLIVFDTPDLARQVKEVIEQLDGDAIVKLAQAPTGEGLLLVNEAEASLAETVSEAISVIDRREVYKEFPLEPSWEQHGFHLDFRSTKCEDPRASLIASIAHQASSLSAEELEILHDKINDVGRSALKI